MSIQLKESSRSEPIEISHDDLVHKIIRGELGPSSLIKSNILTGSTWCTLDNLKIFHRYSPQEAPFGPFLVARIEREERERQRGVSPIDFIASLRSGHLSRKILGVKPAADLCDEQSILGVSRLIACPSFDPAKFYTLKYYRDRIEVHALTTRADVRSLMPEEYQLGYYFGYDLDFLQQDDVIMREGSIEWRQTPGTWNKWSSLFMDSVEIDCCWTPALDGIDFHFEISDGTRTHKAVWSNPAGHRHQSQSKIVNWHIKSAEAAGLGDIWDYSPSREAYRKQIDAMFQEWLRKAHPDVYDTVMMGGGFSNTTPEQDEQIQELRDRWRPLPRKNES